MVHWKMHFDRLMCHFSVILSALHAAIAARASFSLDIVSFSVFEVLFLMICKGLTEDPQRIPSGLTENPQRIQKGLEEELHVRAAHRKS